MSNFFSDRRSEKEKSTENFPNFIKKNFTFSNSGIGSDLEINRPSIYRFHIPTGQDTLRITLADEEIGVQDQTQN